MGNCTGSQEIPEYPHTNNNNTGPATPPSLALPQGVGMRQIPLSSVEKLPISNIPMGYPSLTIDPASDVKTTQNPADMRAANFVTNALNTVNAGNPRQSAGTIPRTDGMHTTTAPWKAGLGGPGMRPS